MSAEVSDEPDLSMAPLSAELSTINVQLMNHGWAKKPLDLSALGTKEHNEVVGVLFDLLGSNVNKVNTLETMASRNRTIAYENERLTKASNSLRSQVVRAESEMAAWKVRSAELEKRLALEEGKTKELREELSRSRKATEGVRVAAGHEVKKIQLKLDKTLSQLTRAHDSGPSHPQRSQGLVLLNPIPAGRIQPVAATQSPLLEQTLRDLVDIRESLQEESEAFRHVVVSTANGLMEALAASQGEEPPARLLQTHFFSQTTTTIPRFSHTATQTSQLSSSTSHPSIANVRLQLLIADVRQRLTDGVPQYSPHNQGIIGPSPEEIEEQKRVEREQEKVRRDLEDRVKDLEVDIVCARQREEEAGRVVEEMARKELEHVTAKGEMDEGFRKQRELLEVERKQVAENKARFEQERKQLETERQAFAEEKRQADVDAVLALIPSTPTDITESPEMSEDGSEIVQAHEVPSEDQAAAPIPVSIPPSPGPSTWHPHLPQSSSPLSPASHPQVFSPHNHNKMRTPSGRSKPKHHVAANRRKSVKTPLSRLVLEKAIRQNSKDSERLGCSVLGAERGRKTNLASSTATAGGVGTAGSPSRKGKERATTSSRSGSGSGLAGSTAGRVDKGKMGLASSTLARSNDKPRSSAGSTSTTSSTSTNATSSSSRSSGSGSTDTHNAVPVPAVTRRPTTTTMPAPSRSSTINSSGGIRQSTSASSSSNVGLSTAATARSRSSGGSEGVAKKAGTDLEKVGGIGPRAAAGAATKKGVWR
ncbi:hypothetical protein IAT40_006772 [Kwoniella sp. CBS 6097]